MDKIESPQQLASETFAFILAFVGATALTFLRAVVIEYMYGWFVSSYVSYTPSYMLIVGVLFVWGMATLKLKSKETGWDTMWEAVGDLMSKAVILVVLWGVYYLIYLIIY